MKKNTKIISNNFQIFSQKKIANFTFLKQKLDRLGKFINRRFTLHHLSFIIITSFIILIAGCQTPSEGCLDIDATNFDAAADESCMDCCTYPKLKLKILHSVTSTGTMQQDTCITHSVDSVFTNGGNNYFKIKDISFYLSDIQLVTPSGAVAEVEDRITLSVYDDLIAQTSKDTIVKNDFVLVERGAFSYTLGKFRAPGMYAKVRFKIGIPPALNSTDVDTLVTTHALSGSKGMHFDTRGQGFVFQKFIVVKDTMTSLTETSTYEIGQIFTNAIEVELDFSKVFDPGFDVEIPLKVNYTTWLKGINFATDTEASIKSAIVNNAAEAFTIGE